MSIRPPRWAPTLLASIPALSGCAALSEWTERAYGLASRVAVQGFALGVEEPDDDDVAGALAASDYATGVEVTAFLADAAELGEMEEAPILGANVAWLAPSDGSVRMRELGLGRYSLDGGDGISYVPGEAAALSTVWEDRTRRASVRLPPAPRADLPTEHEARTPLAVDIGGQGFDGLLVVVVAVPDGRTSWTNLPVDVDALYSLSQEGGPTGISLPPEAFPGEGLFAVGLGGLTRADPEDFEELNTMLSGFLAAEMTFARVCTLPAGEGCP